MPFVGKVPNNGTKKPSKKSDPRENLFACFNDIKPFDWSWTKEDNSSNIVLVKDHKEVIFHPVYSTGTAAVRGSKSFLPNRHYYWEIEITTNLYGTDVMIGVCTDKMEFGNWNYRFCSLLGSTKESWGYSYHGYIQHNQLTRQYGKGYDVNAKIGAHLDMYEGKLCFYQNYKQLGPAFGNLKEHKLYPAVCSTAAQSSMKIVGSLMCESNLQMICLQRIISSPDLYEEYRQQSHLTRKYDRKYFWLLPVKETVNVTTETEEDELHTIALERTCSKRKRLSPHYSSLICKKHLSLDCEVPFAEPERNASGGPSNSNEDIVYEGIMEPVERSRRGSPDIDDMVNMNAVD